MAELGVRVVGRDARTLNDLGACTAPTPVEPGDLIALEHSSPMRVVDVLPLVAGARVVPVLARLATLATAAR